MAGFFKRAVRDAGGGNVCYGQLEVSWLKELLPEPFLMQYPYEFFVLDGMHPVKNEGACKDRGGSDGSQHYGGTDPLPLL